MILANFHDFMRSMNKESPIYANFSLKIWIIVNNKQNILGKESFVLKSDWIYQIRKYCKMCFHSGSSTQIRFSHKLDYNFTYSNVIYSIELPDYVLKVKSTVYNKICFSLMSRQKLDTCNSDEVPI